MDQNEESDEMRIMQIPLQTLKRYRPPCVPLSQDFEPNVLQYMIHKCHLAFPIDYSYKD